MAAHFTEAPVAHSCWSRTPDSLA